MTHIDDGAHRLTVVVTPLQPPFPEGVVIYTFTSDDKQLAVSKEDAAAIRMLLSGNAKGRDIVMEAEGDDKVRVTVVQ